jgi:hypothetical protein
MEIQVCRDGDTRDLEVDLKSVKILVDAWRSSICGAVGLGLENDDIVSE